MSGDPGSGLTIGPNAWLKRKLHLRPQHRGVHLVTEEILAGLPELSQFQVRKIKCQQILVSELKYCTTQLMCPRSIISNECVEGGICFSIPGMTAIKYCVMGVFRAKELLAKIEIYSLYTPGGDHAHPAAAH